MVKFTRSFAFRYTLIITGMFVVLQFVVFGVLYWMTLSVYEWRVNATIHQDSDALRIQFIDLRVDEMAEIINLRCVDEPGEFDEYLLASADYEFIAGNIPTWPAEVGHTSDLIDILLLDQDPEPEIHRVRAVTLHSGHLLLVGRNLTQLEHIRKLIRKALSRAVLLTTIVGLVGGYVVSRAIGARVARISSTSRAILDGDVKRRMPVSRRGDEFDELAEQLNAMLNQIERLMKGMRDVTDNIAHDMRKPISRLRNRVEITLMHERDNEAYRETLEQCIEDADDILEMFNGLLTIALAESGRPRESFREVDLSRVVRTSAEVYGPAAEEVGLQLNLRADQPAVLTGDPNLLAQAVANLLDNAVKYARGSGGVTVETRERGDRVVLIVADRGPGIPDHFREPALERFTRLEPSRTTPGSGLGLSLVRAVARLHGADLMLEDNAPGLRITLDFPKKKPIPAMDDR
jgi:signal transduction histidine kinase